MKSLSSNKTVALKLQTGRKICQNENIHNQKYVLIVPSIDDDMSV